MLAWCNTDGEIGRRASWNDSSHKMAIAEGNTVVMAVKLSEMFSAKK